MGRSGFRWWFPLGSSAVLVIAFWWFQLMLPTREPGLLTVDVQLYNYPTYQALASRVAMGELPLWNPYQLCGSPWHGSPQGAFFYPPHVLYLLLPTYRALAILGLVHLLIIALGVLLLAGRMGLGPAAMLLATGLFTLGGTTKAWLVVPQLLEAVAWLPLGCVALLDLARAARPRSAAVLAACVALSWLAGGPQATVYLLYAWAAFVPIALVSARASASRWVATALLAAAGIAIGTLAAGVQLAPSLEMANQGTRAAAALGTATLFPFGVPALGFAHYVYEQTLGHGRRFVVVALALASAAPFIRRHRDIAVWALVLGGLVVGMVVLPSAPLFPLYVALPALAWFRNPSHFLILTDFCLAFAAALVLDAVVRGSEDDARARRARWVVAASAMILGVARARWHEAVPITGAIVALAFALGSERVRRVAAYALVALVVSQLIVTPANTSMFPVDRERAAVYESAADVYGRLRIIQGTDRVWIMHERFPSPELAPRLASSYAVRSLDDYEAITMRRQAEYFTYLLEGRTTPAAPNLIFAGMLTSGIASSDFASLGERKRLLDLAAVRIVAAPAALATTQAMKDVVSASSLRPLPSPGHDLLLYENPHALPRAYVVYDVEPAPPAPILLARLSDPRFDPLVTSYVEGPAVDGGPAPPHGRPATIVRDEPELVELDATLERPGLVVLADSFYPGWNATIDGRPATVMPVNHLFRGVAVDAGTHRIRFAYRPTSLIAGAVASVIGLLAIVGLAAAGRR